MPGAFCILRGVFMATQPSQENIFCNKVDCAKVMGISPRYLTELITDKGIAGPNEYGLYDLKVTIPSYISSLKGNNDKTGLTEARKKLTEKQFEKTAIQIEIAKGALHRAEDVKAITANMVAVTRSRLLDIPNKVTHKVLPLKDPDAIKAVMQAEIHTALAELAGYDPSLYFKRSKDFVLLGGDEVGEETETDDGDTTGDT